MKPRFALAFLLLSSPALARAAVEISSAVMTADKIFINDKTKMGHAEGNIRIEQEAFVLEGNEAEFYWEAATGTVRGASGVNPPWYFTADRMIQLSPDVYYLENAGFTSCDEVPPHYRLLSRRGKLRRGKRITLKNPRMTPDDTPVLWLPIYTKSLIPHKYRLRIEPGQSSRDGMIVKTRLGYPFSENTWTNFRWDFLQFTGNGGGIEHVYNTPNIKGVFDSYYIRDSNPDAAVPRSKRYTILWNHYQRLSQRLSLNSKLDLKSDQSFGNSFGGVGNEVAVENTQRGLFSEGGFTYQFQNATLQAQADRKDKFDSTISSKQFISHITLPRLIFNTVPLTSRLLPFYTSFNGTFTNDTEDRSDPARQLRYKKNVRAGLELKKDIKIRKRLTLTPVASYSQSWDNRVLGSTDIVTEKDQYIGRYTVGMDARRRFFRLVDLRLGYRYSVRNRLNQTRQEINANDYGVENNQLTGALQTRLGRSTLVSLSSGYDYLEAPRDQPDKYRHSSERVQPPSMDLQWQAKKNVTVFFRESYGIFDTRTRTPINSPINTSGELQVGDPNSATMFSQGFSYSKKGFGAQSELFLTNKLKFYLTPKWYVDLFWSYRAVGETKLEYRKVFPIERGIRVVRDLHCWVLRGELSSRPGRTDAAFYIDLKTNMRPERNLFRETQQSVYSTRNDGPDVDELFPVGNPEEHQQ